MVNAYGVLKFIHVLSVILWVGGVAGLSVVTFQIARERNREALSLLVRHATSFGQRVVGPASGLVLLTGIAMVVTGHLRFGTFWVMWGMGGIAAHFLMGAIVIRKRTMEVGRLASGQQSGDDAALISAARRLAQMQLLYIILLASVVAMMVLKPTL
ncbi:MAG: DUF2269 family protein [Gemmatimonadaceae bacterium]